MAVRTVTVSLNANVGGFLSGIGRAGAAADQFAGKLEKSTTTARDGWDRIGSTFLTVGAAAAVGVGAVVKTFADFDQAMSGVAATGQDARNNLDGLRETAIKVGGDTAFSAREAAQGMEELLKAGVSAKDVMGGGLKGAMDLAAAGTMDVASASEIAATAMVQFGKSGADVPHIADLLAAGAGKAQGSVQDMGMALKQSGLVASQFGLSIEETTGTLAAFASSGLIGSDAGTSFKTMLLSLANPSKESAALMQQLGISAYDAQGKFVGITNLAEQLQSKLGGLTQAQRDQALAQIFGNDAVRAANVLFQQGGQGIQDWISKVNDAGYAAETAATKQNNLRGDLEKLGGSFESLFIKAGSGGNDFLRGVVQSAEKVVDAFSKLPSGVQQGALALAAVGAAGALSVGGLMKGVGAISDTLGAWRNLKAESPRTASALTGVGKAAGVAMAAMIALAAINWAGSAYQEGVERTKASIEGLGNAAGAAVAGNFDALNKEFFQTGTNVKTMGDAFRVASQNTDSFRRGAQGVAESLTGVKGDILNAETSIKKLDQSLVGMDLAKAQQAFAAIAAENQRFGVTTEQTAAQLPAFKARLEQAAQALGVNTLSAQDYALWMGGSVPEAIQRAAAAQQAAGQATKEQADAMSQVARSAQDAAKGLLELANANLQLSGSQMGVEAAIDAANEALKENGRTLDITNEKGRANQQALDGIAAAALNLAKSQAEAGKSSVEIGSSMDRNRESFVRSAEAMGMSRDAANQLADQYGLVGSKVAGLAAEAQQGAQQAGAAMQNLTQQLASLPPTTQISIRGEGIPEVSASIGDIRAKLDQIPADKRVTVNIPGVGEVTGTVAELKAKIDALPPEKRVPTSAPGAAEVSGQMQAIQNALINLPPGRTVQITAPGMRMIAGDLEQIRGQVEALPADKAVTVRLPGGEVVQTTAGQVKAAIEGIPGQKQVDINASTNAPAVAGQATGAMQAVPDVNRKVTASTNAPAVSSTATGAMQGVPNVDRKVTASTNAPAVSQQASSSMNGVPNVGKNINVSTNAGSTAAAAQGAMNAVQSVTRFITTIFRSIGSAPPQGAAHGGLGIPQPATAAHYGNNVLFRARGGPTPQTGPPREDIFPAWLARREFVQPEVATDYYGFGIMEAMRQRRIPKEVFSPYGFASGGSLAWSMQAGTIGATSTSNRDYSMPVSYIPFEAFFGGAAKAKEDAGSIRASFQTVEGSAAQAFLVMTDTPDVDLVAKAGLVQTPAIVGYYQQITAAASEARQAMDWIPQAPQSENDRLAEQAKGVLDRLGNQAMVQRGLREIFELGDYRGGTWAKTFGIQEDSELIDWLFTLKERGYQWRFAGGGYTGTQGRSRADDIPAWLSAREFVQPEASVDFYGLEFMEALRQRKIPREAFSPWGFATGGTPAQRTAASRPPTPTPAALIDPVVIADAVAGALAGWQPMVRLGEREVYGVMVDSQNRFGRS